MFPTKSGFRFSGMNSVGGQLCSDCRENFGVIHHFRLGKKPSENNQCAWRSKVAFKLTQRNPMGVPHLLFFFSFTTIVAVPTLHFLINIMNYSGLMDYWANLPQELQFDYLHHQFCWEPSLQLSRHLFTLHLFVKRCLLCRSCHNTEENVPTGWPSSLVSNS